MSPTPPPSFSERLRRFRMDPAALPILVAAVVLVGAVAWLMARPVPQGRDAGIPAVAALETRLAALEGAAARQPALEGLTGRLAALESRTGPDLAPLAGRIATVERSAAELAARPVTDPAELAPRPALDALTRRVDGLAQRAEAAIAQEEARATASSARIEGVARELAARVGTAEQAMTQASERFGGVETALTRRLAEMHEQVAAQRTKLDQQAAQIAELQGQAQRLAALEGRAGRLATLDQLRGALEAGAPLGGALSTLRDPPAALTRFAQAAPPTESALRLRFEDSARAALAASDPGRQGQGVLDSAVSRLSGLVTVRRGEEVVFGDAAAAEIEKSRRAMEAGDLEASLAPLQRLSPPAQEAMRPWVEQARALIEARAALRRLAAG